MHDPTYVKGDIDANPTWKLAFLLSELFNDGAPIGWSQYVPIAFWLQRRLGSDVERLYGD